jgi:alpha-1,2-mannosyltransferase
MSLTDHLSTLAQAPWLRWLLVAALVMLYTGWIGYVVGRDKPLDFYVYYLAAGAFLRGQNAYEISDPAWDDLAAEMGVTNYTRPYRYPPLTAELVAPLTFLSPRTAAALWLVLSAVAAVVAAWWLALSSDTPYRWPLALGGLLLFVPPLTTLHAGQVNLLLLASLALALWAFARRKAVWLGIWLGVGTNLKVIPLALVGYLLWSGQWRALLAAVLVIVALLLVAVPLVGWDGLASYGQKAALLGEPGRLFRQATNQTFNGFFGRLLRDRPALALMLSQAAALVVVIATVVICWPTGDVRVLFPLEFAFIVTALQLIPPFTWYHQLVLLLLPFFVLAVEVIAGRGPRWWLVPLALGFLATDLHGLLWHHITPTLLQSTPFYTTLMLWGMLAWLIIREKREGPVQRSVG